MQDKLDATYLTKGVLELIAPDEVMLLQEFDASRAHYGVVGKGPLGFGLTEAVALLFPFVLQFFTSAIDEGGKEAGKAVFAAIRESLSGKEKEGANSMALTSAIESALREEGVPQESVARTANAIVLVINRNSSQPENHDDPQ